MPTVRGLLDLLAASRGTVTAGLRRLNATTLVAAAAAVAVGALAFVAVTLMVPVDDGGGRPSGYQPGPLAGSALEGADSPAIAGGQQPPGTTAASLAQLVRRPAAAGTPVPGTTGTGGVSYAEPGVAPPDSSTTTDPGPGPTSPPRDPTTTTPRTTAPPTTRPPADSPPGLIDGLLGLLGLG
jgi:hypothetical protein